ncbi:nucleotide-binding domain-containing protein [Dendrothele bispora CBS 962.96]|uniref:Nucleotide-binding domain-containing protein n=1 Tax=Dendrothele bispora (strain CBS 962.96) TaxID=1314807 RepID=A0A4S8MQ35_DENBC|nr:nucleotide-binding domain-containing protein [Dendrothele bispora CBS 962.96]
MTSRPILVCGFGIIGLTTAIRLLQAGYRVVSVAEHLPGDPLTAIYASTAAGAHHLSFASDDDLRQQALDRRTFEVMWEEERAEGETSALMKLRQVEYYVTAGETHIKFYESMPDFRVHSQEELKSFATHTVSFTSLTMDTSPYLSKLVKIFTGLGGIVHRKRLESLRDALEFAPDPLAIVNCTGLGSLKLGDVMDSEMFPVRGQVVVLSAPWIKEGRTRQVGNLAGGEGGERTYIIPRRSGQVIIGGTREYDDWCVEFASTSGWKLKYISPRNSSPVPETSTDIKRRALEIYSELVPPEIHLDRPPVPEDLNSIVIREVVGFRPARKSGLRLERGPDLTREGESVPILHNYGHAGAGWQSCWGCAEEIVRLVSKIFE